MTAVSDASDRLTGSITSSRTALRTWDRNRIWISGAPGIRTRPPAIRTTAA
jgi:hypothetical protein